MLTAGSVPTLLDLRWHFCLAGLKKSLHFTCFNRSDVDLKFGTELKRCLHVETAFLRPGCLEVVVTAATCWIWVRGKAGSRLSLFDLALTGRSRLSWVVTLLLSLELVSRVVGIESKYARLSSTSKIDGFIVLCSTSMNLEHCNTIPVQGFHVWYK